MTEAEFEAITPQRFFLALRYFNRDREAKLKHNVEMTRAIVTETANVLAKKRITPQQIWPLPWEKTETKKENLLPSGEMTKMAQKIWQKD